VPIPYDGSLCQHAYFITERMLIHVGIMEFCDSGRAESGIGRRIKILMKFAQTMRFLPAFSFGLSEVDESY
jgi:hypothetical protein